MNAPQPPESTEELSAQEGYAAWASCYDDDGNPLIPLEGPAVREMLGAVSGRSILDVGCGTGRHALDLAARGASVVAIDQSEAMLAVAITKPLADRVRWIRLTLDGALPFRDGSFDDAVLGLVAEHLRDLDRVMTDLHRVVRAGGRCVLTSLHPDRTAEGQRARFIDPATGLRRPITTIHRSTEEYREIAARSGWIFREARDLTVPEALAGLSPRAARYIGRPLGWAACWERPPDPA